IVEFSEKPSGDALERMRVDMTRLGLAPAEAANKPFLGSMGIYVFSKEALRRVLFDDLPKALDFGREVIPNVLAKLNVQAHLFDDYWEDIGSIGSFYRANMDMT